MGLFNLGVSAIELADIATDGDVGTVFAPLGQTQEGTTKLNFADATITELKIEESSVAADSYSEPGEKTVEFTVANPDLDTLVSVFGGTKTGTGSSAKFSAPSGSVTIEKSLRITPNKGMIWTFPRVSITAKFTSDVGKTTWVGVVVTAKVLQPTKTGVAAWGVTVKS